MAQCAEEAMDCDAEFKTEGHPLIGREVIRSDSKGTVVGWLSAAESDFVDGDGLPAALFHVEYTEGELAGEEEDFELYEVEEALPETIERTAKPWKVTDDNKKILEELRDGELKKPDGARTATQLAAKAVRLKFFQKKKQGAIQSMISKWQLVSQEHKDPRGLRVAAHAKLKLAEIEAKDVTARKGDFIVANHGLDCRSGLGSNKHPRDAALGPVYVRIKNGGSAKDVEEATTEALHAALAVLSYHEAHGRKQLEELERANATRYAAVVKYREKWDDQTILKVDDGWSTSDIDGVRRIKTAPGMPDLLEVVVKGQHFGKQREDTEEGLKEIKRMVEETQSEELGRRAARKEADADLASGVTTLQQKVVEQGITFVSPEQQEALGDDAPAPSWRVDAPPQQQQTFLRAQRTGKVDRDVAQSIGAAYEAAAAARRLGLWGAPDDRDMTDWEAHVRASGQKTPAADRPTKTCFDELTRPTDRDLTELLDALGVDAPIVCSAAPARPQELLGAGRQTKDRSRKLFVEVEAEHGAAVAGDRRGFDSFKDALNARARETGFMKEAIELFIGARLTQPQYAAVEDCFCIDVLIDFDDGGEENLSIAVPEGVVLRPTTFASRWKYGAFRPEWRRYYGARLIQIVSLRAAFATAMYAALHARGLD
ncbi:unnamed protein product [Pelagomonas calceolata]|uniref:Uncharacterized protein n=1 Tax=Pelagomonas calceolata TaxID=35677 RepID=A0A8J2SHC2_9STRA|nr:unnamed protein product [Pelagomonas calceolata]